MKNIVLYAPPAAGKGTLCEMLVREYDYKVLSIGQILRDQRNPETEIGRIIIETQDKGVLTPDNIVKKAIQMELEKYKGIPTIIEGYPRNIKQAKMLDSIIDNYIVINLVIDRDTALQRSLGRVNCPNCGKIYNKYIDEIKPQSEKTCDICGEELNTRSDDNEDSFNTRYDVYETNAQDIINFYKEKGIIYFVNSNNDKTTIYSQIKNILK